MRKRHYMILAMLLVPLIILTVCGGAATASAFTLTSTAFGDGGAIPSKYTLTGANRSPELSWSGAPAGTKSFVLIFEDTDIPRGPFTLWVVYNIPSDVLGLAEGQPLIATLSNGAVQGTNSYGRIGYAGPNPLWGVSHNYYFKLYALDTMLNLTAGVGSLELSNGSQVLNGMSGHILGQVEYGCSYYNFSIPPVQPPINEFA
jgi:Raf kinase inhibitor-like YbhB/YbcL family protein